MRAPLLVLAFALALVPPAGAEECVPTTSTTDASQVVLESPAHNGVVDYVAIDLCWPGCTASVWPYYEINGIPGLQRGDEMHDDTCGGAIQSDTWLQ